MGERKRRDKRANRFILGRYLADAQRSEIFAQGSGGVGTVEDTEKARKERMSRILGGIAGQATGLE